MSFAVCAIAATVASKLTRWRRSISSFTHLYPVVSRTVATQA